MLIQFDFIPIFLKVLSPIMLGISLGDIGSFFFGSDSGARSRRALEEFGLTGGGEFGGGLSEEANLIALLTGAGARQRSGARLAREGLLGTGIADDIMQDADLLEADTLRKARFDLIRQRIAALTGTAQTPRTPGLIESAAPVATAAFLGGTQTG